MVALRLLPLQASRSSLPGRAQTSITTGLLLPSLLNILYNCQTPEPHLLSSIEKIVSYLV